MTSDESRHELLEALKDVEKRVRADLLAQYRADPALMARAIERLRAEESSQADSKAWLETFAGRGAVLYILKTLYVRVLEDQNLLRPIRIRDGGTYGLFRQLFPRLGHAAYLRRVFDDAERALPELFAPTPIEIATPSADAASAVWGVWQQAAAGGGPRFDFRGELDTRFIGDLYQDLDPAVKARYALLQTPRFIEEFILDRTMDPALADFGLDEFRIIDPTCGSGHFLLGAFERLTRAWRERLGNGPDARWDAARRALDGVYGADLNEYAVALSRFRLLLATVRETGVTDLDRLRTLHTNVIVCDSLIPWERLVTEYLPGVSDTWLTSYGTAEERARNAEFFERGFHAVVGNPPYIAVKDKKKRADYRLAWPRSASGKYSLSAPMTERFLLLPLTGGRSGIIVANNFCKRSFGKGVVEKTLRDVRLDLVVDTSGAYIPGHGTPTVMLFATNVTPDLKTNTPVVVAGKRGEPRQPADAAIGLVWSAIAAHASDVGYEDTWIAVQRVPQKTLVQHPWSLGSDAVLEIKAKLDAFPRLRDLGADAGFAVIIAEDEAFIRRYARALPLRPIVFGEDVRDWRITPRFQVLAPLGKDLTTLSREAAVDLWPLRSTLWGRPTFAGKTYRSSPNEKTWWQFHQVVEGRIKTGSARIVVGETATNSQFVSDSSDAIFSHSAPVITIRDADAVLYQDVAALLNTSTLEFWFKQVCFRKGGDIVGEGRVPGEAWDVFYVRNGTNVIQAPLQMSHPFKAKRAAITAGLESALDQLERLAPHNVVESERADELPGRLLASALEVERLRERLVGLQEELDWETYGAFNLLQDTPLMESTAAVGLSRGDRPFEIALARRIESGEEESAWFERHGLAPHTEIPDRYIGAQRAILERRLTLIEVDPTIAILEQPVYKRRWIFEPWDDMLREATNAWLVDALEVELRASPNLLTLDELTSRMAANPKGLIVAGYAKLGMEVTLADTIARLLTSESIPDNPAAVLTPAGLAKLIGSQTAATTTAGTVPAANPFAPGEAIDWKRTWRLQEREDADPSFEIVEVPPPFVKTDYAHANGWRGRGKFNIANERFIVFDDLTPKRYAWGGCTVAERARLSSEAVDLRGREPDGASVQPTLDDPRRCAIQFPLWDKLDELRRTNDPGYEDVRELAALCERACPCDVLARWRETSKPTKGRRSRSKGLPEDGATSIPAPVSAYEPDAAATERLFDAIRRSGVTGVTEAELEPLFAGVHQALATTLEMLRANGRIEFLGRGRKRRYRAAELRLVP
jgi:hypothetical protein